MARYQTRRYVAMSWVDATRLARLDGTPLDDVVYSPEARLVHRTDWWAFWSDGQLTTAIGLPEEWQLRSMSVVAEELITAVWMSDSPSPECGWATLAAIQDVIRTRLLEVSLQSPYYPVTRHELVVEFRDGRRGTLYQRITRRSDGYLCEITQ